MGRENEQGGTERLRARIGELEARLEEAALDGDRAGRNSPEEQLLETRKLESVGLLAGGLAHAFNNVLQMVFTHVDFALGEDLTEEETRAQLVGIRESAERGAALTRRLLAFGRRQVLNRIPFDLHELVSGALDTLRQQIGERIEVEFRPGAATATVHGDPFQIEQVLLNLCLNARDAMPAGGAIRIGTQRVQRGAGLRETHPWVREGAHILLSVADNGIGMDEETRRRVFDPFFSTKEPGRGMGLGLSSVYGIVRQHEGVVEVESEPGEGAVFTVSIPAHAGAAIRAKPARAPNAGGGGETVLLAEDDDLVRGLVERALKGAGYRVLGAIDGEEAVRVFERDPAAIDLALIDLVMPRGGGRAVYDRLSESRPGVRFLFTSGYSAASLEDPFVVDRGLRLIEKPYHIRDLLQAVRDVLDEPREIR